MCNLSCADRDCFHVEGRRSGQNKCRREVSETELESKVVGLKNASEQQMCKVPRTRL